MDLPGACISHAVVDVLVKQVQAICVCFQASTVSKMKGKTCGAEKTLPSAITPMGFANE